MIAAGIAARAIAKKLATRAAGGITGAGAKSVNSVYKNTGLTAKSATGRARSNSAAAAKAVAPKNPSVTASKMKMAKTADARRKYDAATERRILDTQVKNSVKVKKNSFDTYSKALGGGTLREIHGSMTKRINSAGLEKAQSKGPRPSIKVIKKPEGKLPKRGK